MRLRIAHSTSYRYEPPATGVIQILRMTPGSHDGQYVAEWQIDVSTDSRLDVHQDAFGNVTHVLTEGPIADLTINVEGLIETHDTGGVLRGTDERFPPSLFLRATSLTETDRAMHQMARQMFEESDGNTLDFLQFQDVFSGLVKAAVFGFLIALMGCYHGYTSKGGAQGVGMATTSAVVSASMLILTFNYFITEAFFAL